MNAFFVVLLVCQSWSKYCYTWNTKNIILSMF